MNDNTNAVALPANIEAAYTKLDRICEQSVGILDNAANTGFAHQLRLANAIGQMRAILTPEVMKPIIELMNTNLGFRTDRDPARPVWKNGKYEYPEPYGYETVRECFIEASLRGLKPVNNEWNIISSGTYATRNGLKRKCEEFKGVMNLKVDLGVPRLSGDKGAIVKVAARWVKDGAKDSIEAEIPVRVNASMGADAILGKAERKIYHRILGRLSGTSMPEGEVEGTGAVDVSSKVEPAFEGPSPSTPTEEDDLEGLLAEADNRRAEAAVQQAPPPPPPTPAPPTAPPKEPEPPKPEPVPHPVVVPEPLPPITPPTPAPTTVTTVSDEARSSILRLRDLMANSQIPEKQILAWMVYLKLCSETVRTLEDVPHSKILQVTAKWATMQPKIKEFRL